MPLVSLAAVIKMIAIASRRLRSAILTVRRRIFVDTIVPYLFDQRRSLQNISKPNQNSWACYGVNALAMTLFYASKFSLTANKPTLRFQMVYDHVNGKMLASGLSRPGRLCNQTGSKQIIFIIIWRSWIVNHAWICQQIFDLFGQFMSSTVIFIYCPSSSAGACVQGRANKLPWN